MEDLKQLKKAIEMDVNRIKVDQLSEFSAVFLEKASTVISFLLLSEASEEFEALWKDFDENGVDYGPYMEGEINVNKGKVRRKSKAGIDDQVSWFSFGMIKDNFAVP